jgi:glucokinase
MSENVYCIADIGGSKILILLINQNREVLFKEKIPTPKSSDPRVLVTVIKNIADKAIAIISAEKEIHLTKIGICTTGFLDHRSGIVYKAENLNWHEPVELGKLISESLATPAFIENDVNAAVLGEVYFGAAKGELDVVYVTISTGIGGGLFLNGRLYRGNKGFAGEIGHMKYFGKGRKCLCGGNDCLESWVSGNAITKSATLMWEAEELNVDQISTPVVFEKAKEGNVIAQRILKRAIENTGIGLSNIVALLNPSCIVIGGGLAAAQPKYFEEISSVIFENSPTPSTTYTPLKIVQAQLEPEAGVWGMFALLSGLAVND